MAKRLGAGFLGLAFVGYVIAAISGGNLAFAQDQEPPVKPPDDQEPPPVPGVCECYVSIYDTIPEPPIKLCLKSEPEFNVAIIAAMGDLPGGSYAWASEPTGVVELLVGPYGPSVAIVWGAHEGDAVVKVLYQCPHGNVVQDEIGVRVIDLEVLQVEGEDSSGNAKVLAKVTPEEDVTQARLVLNGDTHSQKDAFNAGQFQLSLDQNDMSPRRRNALQVEVDFDFCTATCEFNSNPRCNPLSRNKKSLVFNFLVEGGGLVVFGSQLFGRSHNGVWSVSSGGQTSFVLAQYGQRGRGSAAWVNVNTAAACQKGLEPQVSATMTWYPDGPTQPTTASRGHRNAKTASRDATPGRNWWFVPAQGKCKAVVQIIHSDPGGVSPGIPISNEIEISFP